MLPNLLVKILPTEADGEKNGTDTELLDLSHDFKIYFSILLRYYHQDKVN